MSYFKVVRKAWGKNSGSLISAQKAEGGCWVDNPLITLPKLFQGLFY